MFDARDYEDEGNFDRRRPNRQDKTSRSSRSTSKSSAKRSSNSSHKRSGSTSIGGMHNRKNKHWNW